jgi:uncharacterized protein (TIGR00156 family)
MPPIGSKTTLATLYSRPICIQIGPKLILLASLLVLMGCSQVNTDIQNIGRHSAYPETIARARELPANTWVTLTGSIIRSLGNDQYIFQDSTDTIKVAITDQAWNGTDFKPNMQATITGKVELNGSGIRINVAQVKAHTD